MIPSYDELHLGRSFSGHWLEDDCPCPQEACGLISGRRVSPDCDQHGLGSTKTMRQIHDESNCPADAK